MGQPRGCLHLPMDFHSPFLLTELDTLRACLATTVPFRSPIQMTPFLPFQNGEKVIFTAETIVQRNGSVVAK